jgi:cobalt-zinc-cadmium efflux system membrane fusion protein
MFATAQFEMAPERKAIQVPEAAVQEFNGKQVVFVRQSSGSFEPRYVETGPKSGGRVEIVSGLEPGVPVVVSGAFLLKSHLLKDSAD